MQIQPFKINPKTCHSDFKVHEFFFLTNENFFLTLSEDLAVFVYSIKSFL